MFAAKNESVGSALLKILQLNGILYVVVNEEHSPEMPS